MKKEINGKKYKLVKSRGGYCHNCVGHGSYLCIKLGMECFNHKNKVWKEVSDETK